MTWFEPSEYQLDPRQLPLEPGMELHATAEYPKGTNWNIDVSVREDNDGKLLADISAVDDFALRYASETVAAPESVDMFDGALVIQAEPAPDKKYRTIIAKGVAGLIGIGSVVGVVTVIHQKHQNRRK